MIKVFRYQRADGREPVTEWLLALRDKQVQARIRLRIKRLEAGLFGDCDGLLGQLETEAAMKRKIAAAVRHDEREVDELRADRELAVEHLRMAMASLDDPDDRAAGLLALRSVAEAYGGLSTIAADAGISREALYRALSPTGNPTLKTLLAVLKAVGMRLSVEPEGRAAA